MHPFLQHLRIAWSIALGLVATLLIILWVWSYGAARHITLEITKSNALEVSSMPGVCAFTVVSQPVLTGDILRMQVKRMSAILKLAEARWRPIGYHHGLLTVRYWFLVLLSGTLAMLPVLVPSIRFSLRTLLIATTLAAVGLGMATYLLHS
jgi:hypothetical protein